MLRTGPVSLSSSINGTRQRWGNRKGRPTLSRTVPQRRRTEYHHILPTRLTASHKKPLLRPPGGPSRTMHLTTPQRLPASRSRPRRRSNGLGRTASRAACLSAGAPLFLLLPPLRWPHHSGRTPGISSGPCSFPQMDLTFGHVLKPS